MNIYIYIDEILLGEAFYTLANLSHVLPNVFLFY